LPGSVHGGCKNWISIAATCRAKDKSQANELFTPLSINILAVSFVCGDRYSLWPDTSNLTNFISLKVVLSTPHHGHLGIEHSQTYVHIECIYRLSWWPPSIDKLTMII
jgi:hypothetical protein